MCNVCGHVCAFKALIALIRSMECRGGNSNIRVSRTMAIIVEPIAPNNMRAEIYLQLFKWPVIRLLVCVGFVGIITIINHSKSKMVLICYFF